MSAGIPVTIVERDAAALERGMATVRTNYESAVRRGRLASDKLEPLMALLNPALEMERLAECDLVIEAVFEDLDLKKAVFGQLDLIAKP
ncbi:3-hydroxyacyl-CoA dehydrogenase NAD-binding domain-containing protein, partial [Acinetobacter baumannii]